MKKKKTPSPVKKKSLVKRKAATATARKKKPGARKAKGKLTKQAETEARKAHDLYWKSYLVGDIETLASLLDEHYTQIGSVENEVFFNKKDAVKFVKETIDQVAGNVEMRKRVTKAEPVDGFVMLHEQCDLYVLIDGVWTFYSKFRASSLMQKTETGWKMIHQHSSLPDAKAQEGENIALEKIAAENLQLRDAVKRRTVELEQKNRELEIEAALEKIRSRSLAMQHSDELRDVIGLTHEILGQLHVKHDTIAYQVFDFDSRSSVFWPGNNLQDAAPKVLLPYDEAIMKEDTCHRDLWEAMATGKDIINKVYTKAQKDRWFQYVFAHNDVQVIHENARQFIIQSEIHTVCFFPEKNSGVFADSWDGSKYTDSDINVLKRVGKVFEQAYTRFLDLQKAEAQARESEIQLSLERLRARTMAMHKSDELREVVHELFVQLNPYGLAEWGFQLRIAKEDRSGFFSWLSTPAQRVLPECYDIPTLNHWALKKYWTIYQEQRPFDTVEVTGKDKLKMDLLLFEKSELKNLPAKVKKNILSSNYVLFSVASMKYGLLEAIDVKPKGSEEIDILKRFAKVFEQTYTRFLDLQKAEAQAREAEIQLALERVRARTMAMHHSDELPQVAFELFEQMHHLGFAEWGGNIALADEEKGGFHAWFSTPAERIAQAHYFVPNHGHPLMEKLWSIYKEQTELYILELRDDKKAEYTQWLFDNTSMGNMSEKDKAEILSQRYVMFSFSAMKYGLLEAISHDPMPQELNNILPRFAKVFEQTYTRFLDLKKAEAQAREAQIEAALERVRAQSMAMHKSNELQETVAILYKEIQSLGFETHACVIVLYDESNRTVTHWVSGFEKNMFPQSYSHPYFDHPYFHSQLDAWKSGIPYKVFVIEGQLKKSYDKQIFALGDMKDFPEDAKMEVSRMEKLILSDAFMKYGMLEVFLDRALDEKSARMLQRFSQVFEQTYTRFLDLQKAEAQAREAQIEAALERVRSRSMAMHLSNELAEVAHTLYEELQKLDFTYGAATVVIMNDETGDMEHWVAGFSQKKYPECYQIKYFDHPCHKAQMAAWRRKQKTLIYELAGQERVSYTNYIFEHTGYSNFPENEKEWMKNTDPVFTLAYMKHGALMWAPNSIKENELEILQRFAKVFEQSYTRFLDLQKAEAQAREAQIEAALEKVRSTSLAMHHSSELEQVAGSLFDRLAELGLSFDGALIFTFDKEKQNISLWIATNHLSAPVKIDLPYDKTIENNRIIKDLWNAIEHGENIINRSYSGEDKNDYFRFVAKYNESKIPETVRQLQLEKESWTAHFAAEKNSMIGFDSWSGHITKDEDFNIVIRFAKVFEQAYTRFLDLQKAEAQAREAQIEAALERIRSSAMAMHSSEGILDVTQVLREQIAILGEKELESILVHIYHEDTDQFEAWYSYRHPENTEKQIRNGKQLLSWSRTARARKDKEKYHEEASDYTLVADYNMLKEWYEYLLEVIPEVVEINAEGQPLIPEVLYYNYSKIAGGTLLLITNSEASDHSKYLLRRAAIVFNLAYSRFLDLQKVEAQAREAKIETALERVRSRSLAMHNSSELSELVATLFDELIKLDLVLARCIIWILHEDGSARLWMANSENKQLANSYYINRINHSYYNSIVKGWKERNEHWVYELKDAEKASIDQILLFETELRQLPEEVKQGILTSTQTYVSGAFNKFGLIEASGPVRHTEEQLQILHRFNKVFEQSYTRFLDLQKAEAQAREAQIETALERVRSRSMGMHKSEELREVIQLIFEQFRQLNFNIDSAQFDLNFRETDDINIWTAVPGQPYPSQQHVPYMDNAVFISIKEAKKMGLDFFSHHYSFEEKNEFFHYFFKYVNIPEERKKYVLESPGFVRSVVFLDKIYLGIQNYSGIAYSDSEHAALKRFAKVFEQTYTRFLDLQKAEAQAREAQIEASLERVRSKTMAMHNSEDVGETVATLFDELMKLGVEKTVRCGIIIVEDTKQMEVWTAADKNGKVDLIIGHLDMNVHALLLGAFDAWKNKQAVFTYELAGNDLKDYFRAINNSPDYPLQVELESLPIKMTNTEFYFGEGAIFTFTLEPIPDESVQIFKRFAGVFGQTYRRYLDLQKAEAQAREAVKQSTLDRVRGEIASMRSTADLDRITPLIWKELTTLGIPFIRCGVFIMDEHENKVHTYLSTPDGRAIAAYHISMDDSGNLAGAIDHWRKEKVFVTHWVDSDFQIQADILLKQGSITSREQYLNSIPKEGFHLHFLPFRQGMLYVGSNEQLQADALQLVQSLADAFSVAYARYEDFTRLESAKTQIEKTLTDLKQTQAQLVQSEKMASLGELTAGIAHEIQNPLNFVNNFSEVSTELVDEMNEELLKGNTEDAKQIAIDLKQNLEKINHHGKRAGDIVKGMLQHSRSSSGVKEPTDINALADEYLRLAYHGLRAKDKSFNAKFEMHPDPDLPKVNVLPQDVGRVILNLINNAFYAVTQKLKSESLEQKAESQAYEPTVTVTTKNLGDSIEIRIRDNGTGIPEKVKEKIFQPFFTTKPTGQGTGLGLSLSYDIITKGHGGELKVETKEGNGTTFIINLPVV